MWVRTSGVWRNFRPDVDGTFTKGSLGTDPRYRGWSLGNDPWSGGSAYGTRPSGNRDIFGNHQIEAIFSKWEILDPKVGHEASHGVRIVLSGTPAAGLVERLTTATHGLETAPGEITSGVYRAFTFSDTTEFTTSGSETFRVGGD